MTEQFIARLIICLIAIESGGQNISGDNGAAAGILQIHKIFVDDVNRILGKDKYTYDDRWNEAKSREMVTIWFRHYSKHWSQEKCIRWYNAGGNWQCEAAERYYKKVQRLMKGVKK